MRRHRARGRGDAGESLVEILVAISILGVSIVALTGGLAASILDSSVHRQHATGDTIARSVAECLKDRNLAYQQNGVYAACAGDGASITTRWWNGDSPATFGTSQNSNGLQELTVTVAAKRGTETVTILKRRT
jgi:Tfp pilus assembly protein PilV